MADTVSLPLLELALGINAINVLDSHNIMDDTVWFKHMLVTLFHGSASILALNDMLHSDDYRAKASSSLLDLLKSIFPRSSRRQIEKAGPIRNAMVHYDFSDLIGTQLDGDNYRTFSISFKQATSSTVEEFCRFMEEEAQRVSALLLGHFDLPR